MAESRSVILEITSPALQCGAADGIISPSMRSRGWNHQPLEAEPGREAAAGAEVLADRRGGTSRREKVSEIIKLPEWQD
ncbi:MAG: hypothetical protein GX125_07390 [Bacteroidales bacterium]|jgi:hypothetical protein|nr:hypothetical protein [Bacteroidota bacterium]NLO00064.1 hypothetical protein [Bacteroidales bacterium]